jgi:hypothetical protein
MISELSNIVCSFLNRIYFIVIMGRDQLELHEQFKTLLIVYPLICSISLQINQNSVQKRKGPCGEELRAVFV